MSNSKDNKIFVMSNIIDGKKLAGEIRSTVKQAVSDLNDIGVSPGLATVIVGNDSASRTYVKNKIKSSNEVGIKSFNYELDEKIDEEKLIELIRKLNSDEKVDAILVQLPLPKHLCASNVIDSINPDKDVDGFSLINAGRTFLNRHGIVPCTPMGCLLLLRSIKFKMEGKHAVIIGRSNIVGKPMSQLLLNENCTVTVAHSYTNNLSKLTREADIIIAATGKHHMIKKDWVKKGAVVIDVGINRIIKDKKTYLVGDVDFKEVYEVASYITPVPGGVGPMTIACLLVNTVVLAASRRNIKVHKDLESLIN